MNNATIRNIQARTDNLANEQALYIQLFHLP